MVTWTLLGRLAFVVTYPLLAIYLSRTHRTRCIVRCGDEVLLVKSWLWYGAWDLPGGGLHRDEKPEHGAIRELGEELGLVLNEEQVRFVDSEPYRAGLISYKASYTEVVLETKPELKLQKTELVAAQWVHHNQVSQYKINKLLIAKVSQVFNN